MAKLKANETDDVILDVDNLTIRAIATDRGGLPAKEWFLNLSEELQARVAARAEALADSWDSNRPTRDLWKKVTDYDLWEFLGTAPRAREAIRMYGERETTAEGHTLWVAFGHSKKRQSPKGADLKRAETMVAKRKQK